MNRAQKQEAIDSLNEVLKSNSAMFALDFRGLKVAEATALRIKIRESGARYKVVKNTLTLRALKETAFGPLAEHFKGMTGLAYTNADPIALAKVLNDFSKDVPALSYKGGMVSGRALDAAQFKALATLPGKTELQAQLLSVLQAPARNLLGVLQAPVRDLLLVLQAAVRKAEAK